MDYKRLNVIAGWATFLVASVVYLLTIPHTTSFWDCGEFIASAYKLEVSHSPGAPLFMVMGRFFTLFAASPADAATMINAMSGIASAATIMFLFWTITHLAQKIMVSRGELTLGRQIAILGAGFVGAFAYMFTDTFWFSAVEGEVYALSSLFTAVVFWAILKWENVADEAYSNRWLILIAYLVGLSIGVHLLNLLAIPAIIFVYYFRKYPTSKKGVIAAGLISVVLLAFIMYFIIPNTVALASYFDRLFVNGLGMPFNSGVVFFAILLIASLIYGIWYTHKKGMVLANTIILGITVILIGYSSYTMTVVRSNANPPMDQNDPEDLFSLLSYLNREQYGDRPLVKGHYYSAPVVDSEDKPSYRKNGDEYEKFVKGFSYIYHEDFITYFPRMYSSDQNHVREYERWGHVEGTPIQVQGETRIKPTFGENIRYFLSYQIAFMYGRYFMWNFVGRQNDIQGHGEAANGNWLSGIPFVDNTRLGDQSDLPDNLANHNARNTYYFLPFLLGLIGLLYHYSRHRKDFWVVTMLFVLTGIAIVVYLNQNPLQPRERDYAYAGSFYAFAIWIGLGVLALYDGLRKVANQKVSAVAASVVCLVAVPGLLGSENWDDHDRSGRYTARDFAFNYLNSCEKNGIIFTNGDNDTFPLWYLQEVEEERTDVRIVCLPYLSTDWYIDQMKKQAYDSDPVPFSMEHEKYRQGTRDMIYVQDRPDLFINERFEANKSSLSDDFNDLVSDLQSVLESSSFADQEPSTWEVIKNGDLTPVQLASLINKLSVEERSEKYGINLMQVEALKKSSQQMLDAIGKSPMPLKLAMDFVANDASSTKLSGYDGSMENYIPAKKFVISIDKQKVIENGAVQPSDTALIVDRMVFSIRGRMLMKSDMMILDLLANNNWDRPIYFSSIGRGTFADLQNYSQLEGFAYRIVPIKNTSGNLGRINSGLLYDRFFNTFMYRNLNNDNVHLDWTNRRTLSVVSFRRKMGQLAQQFIKEGKKQKAIETLDKALEILPISRQPLDFMETEFFDGYYQAGARKKGDQLMRSVFESNLQELNYYLKNDPRINAGYQQDQQIAVATMQGVVMALKQNNANELFEELKGNLKEVLTNNSNVIQQIESYTAHEKNLMNIFFSLQDNSVQQWFQNLPPEDRAFIVDLNNLKRQDIRIMQLYVSWIGV
ncbi:MAG: DUF2723 domain-containing protein [Salinivirgaceae bacterium]|jgi:tetratricopeptide (TPR) repeat protein|nr:DUF2723 domain-containing protein [Salinivirgaceae bacterium]